MAEFSAAWREDKSKKRTYPNVIFTNEKYSQTYVDEKYR